ncbi:SRPBCC family protein [Sulfitobacter sp. CW3]|uniref:SRPBCC family protein n=1 Tax=Sulfitobacter sp. CW3 TaxID=2861965 RepID=UPI001C5D4F8D|nr:SRPBCC family protein [Sulfitobacter sp. CW3]MBW4961729.1 SRPBCC family protein [Sulfitobacter sp. CW3]
MKFSTKEDIDVPIDAVFEMLCEFDTFERAAMRRGAEVRRVDTMTEPGTGMKWETAFDMRGKRRDIEVEMVTFEHPTEICLESMSPGLLGAVSFDLLALSRSRTRVAASIEIKPKTLSARLLVQSLKLAKTSLTKKFKRAVAGYTKDMEERYQQSK